MFEKNFGIADRRFGRNPGAALLDPRNPDDFPFQIPCVCCPVLLGAEGGLARTAARSVISGVAR